MCATESHLSLLNSHWFWVTPTLWFKHHAHLALGFSDAIESKTWPILTHTHTNNTVKCLPYIHSKGFIQCVTFIMPLKVQSQELPVSNFSMPCALAKPRAVSKAASVPTAAYAWPLHISSFHTPFLLHLLECWVFFSDLNEGVFLLKGVCVGRVKDDLIPSRQEKERKRLI